MLTETPTPVNSTDFVKLLSAHPLPWGVERGWTYEITAQDGTVLAKLHSQEEAARFIELAEIQASTRVA